MESRLTLTDNMFPIPRIKTRTEAEAEREACSVQVHSVQVLCFCGELVAAENILQHQGHIDHNTLPPPRAQNRHQGRSELVSPTTRVVSRLSSEETKETSPWRSARSRSRSLSVPPGTRVVPRLPSENAKMSHLTETTLTAAGMHLTGVFQSNHGRNASEPTDLRGLIDTMNTADSGYQSGTRASCTNVGEGEFLDDDADSVVTNEWPSSLPRQDKYLLEAEFAREMFNRSSANTREQFAERKETVMDLLYSFSVMIGGRATSVAERGAASFVRRGRKYVASGPSPILEIILTHMC